MTSDVQVIPDRAYLLALGYGAMGPEALDALEVVIAEEIEDRVGRRLARSLTLSDFDRFHDLLDEDREDEALDLLLEAEPDLDAIVRAELDTLGRDLADAAPLIVSRLPGEVGRHRSIPTIYSVLPSGGSGER